MWMNLKGIECSRARGNRRRDCQRKPRRTTLFAAPDDARYRERVTFGSHPGTPRPADERPLLDDEARLCRLRTAANLQRQTPVPVPVRGLGLVLYSFLEYTSSSSAASSFPRRHSGMRGKPPFMFAGSWHSGFGRSRRQGSTRCESFPDTMTNRCRDVGKASGPFGSADSGGPSTEF